MRVKETSLPRASTVMSPRRRTTRIIACVLLAVLVTSADAVRARPRAMASKIRLGGSESQPRTTDDCASCRAFMRAIERKITEGKFQGDVARAIARACEEATGGSESQMGVCVAAGEAGLRFATRWIENHPELEEQACDALDMCEGRKRARSLAIEGVERAGMVDEVRRRARGDVADDSTCADCVMATELLANEIKSNSTINFVEGEVDALCAALGPELAHQCDAVLEPYVPALLNVLAEKLRDACAKIGACPKLDR